MYRKSALCPKNMMYNNGGGGKFGFGGMGHEAMKMYGFGGNNGFMMNYGYDGRQSMGSMGSMGMGPMGSNNT